MKSISSNPTIIDVEASGFGPQSYPIEVGVVRHDGERYCRLIKPFDDWDFWEISAEKVHGITRLHLMQHGISGADMCFELNQFLGKHTAYSDGWVVDSPWLNTLYERAGIEMSFHISSLEMILNENQMNLWHGTQDKVIHQLQLKRHRASNDALIIKQTFNWTLNA